jgi:uncharacterized protein YpmB
LELLIQLLLVLVEQIILTVLTHLWVQFQPQRAAAEAAHLLLKQELLAVVAAAAVLRIQTKVVVLAGQEQVAKVLRVELDYH